MPSLPRTLFGASVVLALVTALFPGCSSSKKGDGGDNGGEVVVYTSVDDVHARLIAERFTKDTGIEVRLVADTEETKSTGLLNRLIA
jgi:hypothetical protein